MISTLQLGVLYWLTRLQLRMWPRTVSTYTNDFRILLLIMFVIDIYDSYMYVRVLNICFLKMYILYVRRLRGIRTLVIVRSPS